MGGLEGVGEMWGDGVPLPIYVVLKKKHKTT